MILKMQTQLPSVPSRFHREAFHLPLSPQGPQFELRLAR